MCSNSSSLAESARLAAFAQSDQVRSQMYLVTDSESGVDDLRAVALSAAGECLFELK